MRNFKETVLQILCFRKGYRVLSCMVYFLIFSLLMIPVDNANNKAYKEYKEKTDYQKCCAENDFAAAHAIQTEFYTEYSRQLGKWRSGEWCEREARQKQERYRSTLAYIFGKELVYEYTKEGDKRDDRIISMLVEIPSEGSPLSEGEHGNGMFYANDAGVGEPAAIDHVVYQSWVRFFNDRCDQVFDLAYSNGDTVLVKKVSKLYKTEIITNYKADTLKGDDYCIAIVKYDNSRREKAIEKSNE